MNTLIKAIDEQIKVQQERKWTDEGGLLLREKRFEIVLGELRALAVAEQERQKHFVAWLEQESDRVQRLQKHDEHLFYNGKFMALCDVIAQFSLGEQKP